MLFPVAFRILECAIIRTYVFVNKHVAIFIPTEAKRSRMKIIYPGFEVHIQVGHHNWAIKARKSVTKPALHKFTAIGSAIFGDVFADFIESAARTLPV